jgi:hypothetical protein
VVVDAGIFLSLGGQRPLVAVTEELGKFARHYKAGGRWGTFLGGMMADMGGLAAHHGSRNYDNDGAIQLSAIAAAFRQADFPVADTRDMTKATKTSVERAEKFYRTVRERLRKEADPHTWQITRSFTDWLNENLLHTEDPSPGRVGDYTLYVTGHSLGGFLAQTVAASQGCAGVTFNAPGAAEYLAAAHLPVRHEPVPVRNLYRSHDVVGSYMTHLGDREPMVDFYMVPAEQGRLRRDWDQAEAECTRKRLEKTAEEKARYEAAMVDYQKEEKDHHKEMKEYQAGQDAHQAAQEKRTLLSQAAHGLARKLTVKSPSKPPQKPELASPADIAARVPNRFGPQRPWSEETYQACARTRYELAGYLLRNHSLASIIEELEHDAGIEAKAGQAETKADPGDGKATRAETRDPRVETKVPRVESKASPGESKGSSAH